MKEEKKRRKKKMTKMMAYLFAAMILAFSSIAMVAAIIAKDVFEQNNPFVGITLILLGVLYFVMFLLIDRYNSHVGQLTSEL